MFDLVPLPLGARVSDDGETLADQIQRVSNEIEAASKTSIEIYVNGANQHCCVKEFEEGCLVLVHLRQERFSKSTYCKLNLQKFEPHKVLKKLI